MPELSSKDFSCVASILESIEKIQAYAAPFSDADALYTESLSFDAVLMNFIVIGEMTSKLSETFIGDTSELIDWYKIKGFRNILAHNYFGVDAEEVWQIVQNDLPELKLKLKKITGS